MKPLDPNSAGQPQIELEAAEWVVRRDAGLTAAQQDEYFHWLASDPRHSDAMARQQQTWKDFGLLAQWKPEHSAEPNPDLLARPRRTSVRTIWLGALAMAACVALALTLWTPWRAPMPEASPLANYAAPSGYERRVLPDGSVVELNRGARIALSYSAQERRVQLMHGEASFTVAKNPARPFIVRVAGVEVRAVGTVFNVRLDNRQVEVLVTEGKVQVNNAVRGNSLLAPDATGEPAILAAGHKVVVAVEPIAAVPVVAVSADETARLLAWQPQMLEFNSAPLAEVVTAFNRESRVQLVIGDPQLRDLPIVASFRTDNTEGFVRLLEMTAGIRAERSGDTITLRKNR